jgi:hypothetical protein
MNPDSDELRILLEEFVFIFNKLVLSGKIGHFRQIEAGDCNLQRVIEMGVIDDGIDNFDLARNMQSVMIKSLDSASECSKLRYWLGREHMSFPKYRRRNWGVTEEDRDEYIQDWIEISSNKYRDST